MDEEGKVGERTNAETRQYMSKKTSHHIQVPDIKHLYTLSTDYKHLRSSN